MFDAVASKIPEVNKYKHYNETIMEKLRGLLPNRH